MIEIRACAGQFTLLATSETAPAPMPRSCSNLGAPATTPIAIRLPVGDEDEFQLAARDETGYIETTPAIAVAEVVGEVYRLGENSSSVFR